MEGTKGFWDDAKVIATYTRAQAIDDGVLLDWTFYTKEAGITFPVAITCGVWAALRATVDEQARTQEPEADLPQDEARDARQRTLYERRARADLICALRWAITHPKPDEFADVRHFACRGLELWAVCGPGDTAAPVITLMLEGED